MYVYVDRPTYMYIACENITPENILKFVQMYFIQSIVFTIH